MVGIRFTDWSSQIQLSNAAMNSYLIAFEDAEFTDQRTKWPSNTFYYWKLERDNPDGTPLL